MRQPTDPGRRHPRFHSGWHLAWRFFGPKPKSREPTVLHADLEQTIRTAMVKWCLWGIKHEPSIHYSQTRPMPVLDRPGTLPLSTDCSGSTTLFAKWAGAPDPNGLGYNGSGYTGSMARHLRQIKQKDAKLGDLVIFGDPVTHHVAVVVKTGADPVLESHGYEGGPLRVTLSQESGYHRGEAVRFFSLL